MSRRAPVWSRHASFDPHPTSASLARSFVADQLAQHGLSRLVEPVRLVTSELATNAILHARTSFTVTLERLGDVLVLTVSDDSPEAPLRRRTRATDSTGRGLDIVAWTSLDWGVAGVGADASPEGTKAVWASFAVDGQPVL